MMWFKAHWPALLLWAGFIYILLRLYISGRMVRFIDRSGERSLHQGNVLTGGGFLLFVPIAVVMVWHQCFLPATLVLCLTGLGLVDDIKQLSARLRLVIQLTVIIIALWFLGYGLSLWSIFLFLAFLWWVNLFNFMDGANGLVSMHALVALAIPLIFYNLSENMNSQVIFVMIAILIYLYFNVGLKRLFMGDSGSLPLAFILGLMALVMMKTGAVSAAQIAIMHAVLITDASLTLMVRIFRGEHIAKAHRSHLYQRLISLSSVHWPISLAYALVTVACCGLAVMIADSPLNHQILWLISVYLVLTVVFFQTRRLGR